MTKVGVNVCTMKCQSDTTARDQSAQPSAWEEGPEVDGTGVAIDRGPERAWRRVPHRRLRDQQGGSARSEREQGITADPRNDVRTAEPRRVIQDGRGHQVEGIEARQSDLVAPEVQPAAAALG